MNSFIITVLLYVIIICEAFDTEEYKSKRNKLLQDELKSSLGGDIVLTDKEIDVNNCLMQHKFREVDRGFDHPEYFNFSHHFFSYKDSIKKSKVYRIIKDMPKGAVLHVHDMGILGPDYLLNITYMDHLYVCFNKSLQFRFSNTVPNTSCESNWQLMSDARKNATNIRKFDADLRKHFTLVVQNPDVTYPSITETWTSFMNYFITVIPMLTYRPVWEQYFYDALLKFREENIMYVEVRSILPNLYELDGTVYDPVITAKAYEKTINKFVKKYRDFVGAKLIYAPSRRVNVTTVVNYLRLARQLKTTVPNIFAGFDLVGQEDLGSPLIEFVPELSAAGKDINYFFHAGETDWFGTTSDDNLVDAILLGAKRLGHAYALPKHSVLMKEVVKRDIGIEVNVLSNAVLSLVRDVRNHPLSTFLSQNFPVVLSSDDPGIWEADVLSDDFYVAFVGVANRLSDLKILKKLALNSLKYSALEERTKEDALNRFTSMWNEFVNNFNCSLYEVSRQNFFVRN